MTFSVLYSSAMDDVDADHWTTDLLPAMADVPSQAPTPPYIPPPEPSIYEMLVDIQGRAERLQGWEKTFIETVNRRAQSSKPLRDTQIETLRLVHKRVMR